MQRVRESPNDPHYDVELITTVAGIDLLEVDWNRLTASSEIQNIFTTFDWYRAWTRQSAKENGLETMIPHVLVMRHEGLVAGVSPLVLRIARRFGLNIRKLEFVTPHSDYNDLVVGRDVSGLTYTVMNYLARSARYWDLVDLMNLRDVEFSATVLHQAAIESGLRVAEFPEQVGCLYMPINASWPETGKKKHLRFARRSYSGFLKGASEGFRIRVVDHPQLDPTVLNRIIAVEAQKRVNGRLSAPFIGSFPEVFRLLFNSLGPRGFIVIALVEKEDELVGYRLLFKCGTKLWDYQTAYNHNYAELSPGTVLICGAIDFGFQHGCDEFDFLRGMDTYKQRWTQEFRRNKRVLIWSKRLLSRLIACYFARLLMRLSGDHSPK